MVAVAVAVAAAVSATIYLQHSVASAASTFGAPVQNVFL